MTLSFHSSQVANQAAGLPPKVFVINIINIHRDENIKIDEFSFKMDGNLEYDKWISLRTFLFISKGKWKKMKNENYMIMSRGFFQIFEIGTLVEDPQKNQH